VPSWYIHLAYDGHLAGYSLNSFTFAMIARLVERGVAAQYDSADFLRELEAVISGALRREFTLDFMAPRGTVDNARGIRSMLAYGFGQLETDSGPEDFHLATLTTMYLTQGKLVVILQAGRLEAEDGMAAFRQRAQGIAVEIMGKARSE
jgi:hypothetical protein